MGFLSVLKQFDHNNVIDSMDEIFLAVDSMGVDSMGVVMATDPLEFAISVTFVSEK